MKTLILSFLLAPLLAMAQTVGFHVGSYHWPNDRMNNFNPGVYVVNQHFVGGIYHNSFHDTSAYIGLRTKEWNRLSLSGIVVGGYKDPIRPGLLLTARVFTYGNTSLNLSIIPQRTFTGNGRDVLHMTIERRF